MASNLLLHGVPVYVSGVAGHFIGSSACALRMNWRIGNLRISTVGAWTINGAWVRIGAGRWSETMVFRVQDSDGMPEGSTDFQELAMAHCGKKDTRAAERLHIEIASRIAKLFTHADAEPSDEAVAVAVAGAMEDVRRGK